MAMLYQLSYNGTLYIWGGPVLDDLLPPKRSSHAADGRFTAKVSPFHRTHWEQCFYHQQRPTRGGAFSAKVGDNQEIDDTRLQSVKDLFHAALGGQIGARPSRHDARDVCLKLIDNGAGILADYAHNIKGGKGFVRATKR